MPQFDTERTKYFVQAPELSDRITPSVTFNNFHSVAPICNPLTVFFEFIGEGAESVLSTGDRKTELCTREYLKMPGSKIAIVLALALAGTTPAFAGMNGTESINRALLARSSAQTTDMHPERRGVWAHAMHPRPAPEAASQPYLHRYYGGPKSPH